MTKAQDLKNDMLFDDMLSRICEENNISETEAKKIISTMSFMEYHNLNEQPIIPPSGNKIGATTSNNTQVDKNNNPTTPTDDDKKEVIGWSGVGPIAPGMTVGLQTDNKITPASVSKIDNSNKTVTITDPTTQQTHVYSDSDPRIQKYMVKPNTNNNQTSEINTNEELERLKTLAGLKETASSGATSSGNFAISMSTVGGSGNVIRRKTQTEEKWTKEYKDLPGNKTIVGDTKPNQASKKLSADLVANGKTSANRGKKI